jgi:cell division protein FtsW
VTTTTTRRGAPSAKAPATRTRKSTEKTTNRGSRGRSASSGPGRGVIDLRDRRPAPAKATRTRRAPSGHRSGAYLTILSLVITLNLLGLAMILSASSVTSVERYGSPWYQFTRQLLWFGLGLGAVIGCLRVDYRSWRRFAPRLVLGSVVLLVLVLVPGVGMEVNGATRWLGYGPLSIQPSEVAKLALVVFWADLLARRADRIHDWRAGLKPVLVTFAVAAGLIMLQPNLGTATIIFVTMWVMLFVAGVPLKPLGAVLAAGAAAAAMFAVLFPWRWRRISAFRDPWSDPQGVGYQTIQSKVGLANGGITGTGLGQGRAKWGFLPEAHTDFIFTIIGEEAGLIGALVVVGMFVTLAVAGINVALRAADRFGMLLAAGITTWFLSQAFFNIGQSVGALPVMGVPLPFVSSGGSSLVVNMAAAGILLNVARHTRTSR